MRVALVACLEFWAMGVLRASNPAAEALVGPAPAARVSFEVSFRRACATFPMIPGCWSCWLLRGVANHGKQSANSERRHRR